MAMPLQRAWCSFSQPESNCAWFSFCSKDNKVVSSPALTFAISGMFCQTSLPCKEKSFWLPDGLDPICLSSRQFSSSRRKKKKKREIPWQDLSKTSSKLAVANSAHASVLFSQGMAMLRKDHEIPSTCVRYYFTFCFHGGKCVPQSSQRREKPSAADRGVCVSTHQHRLL